MIAMFAARGKLRALRSRKVMMEVVCILLMVFDILAWSFDGVPGSRAYWLVRTGNFGVYLTNYLYMALFASFLWECVGRPSERLPRRAYFTYGLSAFGVGLLLANIWTGGVYTIDAENIYHRGPVFLLAQVPAVLSLVMGFTVLYEYRSRLKRVIYHAMLLYFILPLAATLLTLLSPSLSLQNIGIVIATQVMFAVDLVDISQKLDESETAFRQAVFVAKHDPMTGLLNKATATQLIENYLAEMDSDSGAALVFIDIDNFKQVNDTYGHLVGDKWIITVARLLQGLCRQQDIVCRFGGDEFVMMLKDVTEQGPLRERYDKLAQQMQKKALEQGQDVHCSVGICHILGSGHTLNECMAIADGALYEVKCSGKHACVIRGIGQTGEDDGQRISYAPEDWAAQTGMALERMMAAYMAVFFVDSELKSYRMIKEAAELEGVMPVHGTFADAQHAVMAGASQDDRAKLSEFLAPTHLRHLSKPESLLTGDLLGGQLATTILPAAEKDQPLLITVQRIV